MPETPGPAPVVVALGGNAISPAAAEDSITRQFAQTRRTAAQLADLVQSGAPLIVTHGNGPQIGAAIRRMELSAHEVYQVPLGVCVADLQGGLGYMISQCINNELIRRDHRGTVTTLVTNVLVDGADPAFERPTKPIGSFFSPDRARELIDKGWHMVEIEGRGFRRVVPSPEPEGILEIDLIRRLMAGGETIIAVGGGGIPIVRGADGTLEGREAVIDKDLASGLLAREIDAGLLVIVTAVPEVSTGFGTPGQQALPRLTVSEARGHLDAGEFPVGSMGPKIRAAVEFLEASRRADARVIISDMDHMSDAIAGRAGTSIVPDP